MKGDFVLSIAVDIPKIIDCAHRWLANFMVSSFSVGVVSRTNPRIHLSLKKRF